MKKLVIIILIVVIIACGYVFAKKYNENNAPKSSDKEMSSAEMERLSKTMYEDDIKQAGTLKTALQMAVTECELNASGEMPADCKFKINTSTWSVVSSAASSKSIAESACASAKTAVGGSAVYTTLFKDEGFILYYSKKDNALEVQYDGAGVDVNNYDISKYSFSDN